MRKIGLLLVALVFGTSAAIAADVTVTLAPTGAGIPGSVSIETDDTGSVNLAPYPPSGLVYTGKLAPKNSEWVTQGLVVARWGTRSQPIRLRVTQLSNNTLPVWVFHYNYSADKGTLDAIDDGNTDLSSNLTRYFVARDVYSRIGTMHEVKIRALRLWYDAAYNLSVKKRYFAVDEDVINKAAAIEKEARTNSETRKFLLLVNPAVDYFTENNRQFKWTFYDEISKVQRLAAAGYFEAAQLINDYYIDQVSRLSESDRQEMLKIHRLSPDALTRNSEFLKSALPTQKVLTRFPNPNTI